MSEIDLSKVRGCPVADGHGPCCWGCGGGWPGTTITTEALQQAAQSGRLVPSRLGCGTLQQNVGKVTP